MSATSALTLRERLLRVRGALRDPRRHARLGHARGTQPRQVGHRGVDLDHAGIDGLQPLHERGRHRRDGHRACPAARPRRRRRWPVPAAADRGPGSSRTGRSRRCRSRPPARRGGRIDRRAPPTSRSAAPWTARDLFATWSVMPLATVSVSVVAMSRPPSGSASRSRMRAWTFSFSTHTTDAEPIADDDPDEAQRRRPAIPPDASIHTPIRASQHRLRRAPRRRRALPDGHDAPPITYHGSSHAHVHPRPHLRRCPHQPMSGATSPWPAG